jgi:WD40 repeat protein
MPTICRRTLLTGGALLLCPVASDFRAARADAPAGPPEKGKPTRVGLSVDARRVITTDAAGTVRVWDTERGRLLCEAAGSRFAAAQLSPSGRYVAISGYGETASRTVLLETDSGKLLWERSQRDSTEFYFASDERSLLLVTALPTRRISFSTAVVELPGGGGLWGIGRTWDHSVVVISPASDLVAIGSSTGTNPVVSLRELRTGVVRAEIRPERRPVRLAFSAEGRQLAIADLSGAVELWEVAAPRRERSLPAPQPEYVPDLRFSPIQPLLAVSASTASRTVPAGELQLWNSATGQRGPRLESAAGMETPVFSSDGKYLAASSSVGSIRVWDSTTGAVLQTLDQPVLKPGPRPDAEGPPYGFTPNGKALIAVGPEGLRCWDLRTGKLVRSFALR